MGVNVNGVTISGCPYKFVRVATCSITGDVSCLSSFYCISYPSTKRGFRCSGEYREVLDVSGVGCCWEVVENIGATCNTKSV